MVCDGPDAFRASALAALPVDAVDGTVIAAFVVGARLRSDAGNTPPHCAEDAGSKSFAARCAGCHGADARGTDRGPALARSRRLQAYSLPQLRRFIQKGAPATGMPPFDLPDAELDALAALVLSLNAPAANERLPGDSKAGELFFFGNGQCASCHMVQGRGAATGPDLSSVGARLTVDDIRESLLKPGSRAVAGYELVTVELRDGRSLRGFSAAEAILTCMCRTCREAFTR